jgi:predicted nucleic acid-binding protein
MTVVSHTSPIINLAAIGQLALLQPLYSRLIIPQAVYQEIAVTGAGEPGAREVQALNWITRYTVADHALVSALSVELDPGEAEAIACAVELKAERLLIDELPLALPQDRRESGGHHPNRLLTWRKTHGHLEVRPGYSNPPRP